MKGKSIRIGKGVLAPLFIFSILLIAFCSVGIGIASAQTAVSIDPLTKTVDYGEEFTLNIKVDPAVAIAGMQCNLAFDTSVVTVESVTEGGLLDQDGASTYFAAGTIDNVAGTVTGIAGAITTVGATVSSEGIFAVVTLTASSADGTTTIDLSNVVVGDINGDAVEIEVTDGSVTVGEVTVTAVSVDPLTQTVGYDEEFTLNIKVDPAVAIAGMQCNLAFDTSVVTVESVTEGGLLDQDGASTYFAAGTIDNVAGTVTGIAGAITTVGATVSSEGIFAVVTLTASSADGTTTIDLSNVVVGDINGDAVEIEVTDGSVTVEEEVGPVLTTIEILPETASVAVGGTQTFTATAYDQFDEEMAGVTIGWVSANASVGDVDPTTAITVADGTATTTFTALAVGTTMVVGGTPTVYDTVSVTVTPVSKITVSPSTATVYYGKSVEFTATATDADGVPVPDVNITWSTDPIGTVDPTTATTGADGKATTTFTAPSTKGTATVTATGAGVSGTASVTVRKKPSGGVPGPSDSDGDGYSDLDELLAGTDPDDAGDYPGPTPTPAPATPTPSPTPTVTPPVPTPAPATPAPATPAPTPEEEPGFGAVFAIAGLLAVAYLTLRRKKN